MRLRSSSFGVSEAGRLCVFEASVSAKIYCQRLLLGLRVFCRLSACPEPTYKDFDFKAAKSWLLPCRFVIVAYVVVVVLYIVVSYVSLFRLSNAKFNLYDVLIVFAAATTFIIHNHFVHFDCFGCCSFCRFSRILMFFYSFIVLSVIYDL